MTTSSTCANTIDRIIANKLKQKERKRFVCTGNIVFV